MTKNKRFTISVDEETFKVIEEYHFENRFQSRSDATNELLRIGLECQDDTENNNQT